MLPEFHFHSLQTWRDWLAAQHHDSHGIWMVFYKKHTGKPTISYEDAVQEALCWGWIDSLIKKIDEDRYARKFTPRQPESKWSPSNIKRVEKLIATGRMQPSGMQRVVEGQASGAWENPATAPQEFNMPPEFAQALQDHPQAYTFFNLLASTYQKHFVGWIATAKRAETRNKRITEAIEKLSRGEKLGLK